MAVAELTIVQKQALRIVATRGAENAENVLSKWISDPVTIEVGEVDVLPFSTIVDRVGGEDATIAAVVVRLEGDIEGSFFCVFSEDAAMTLANTMLKRHGRSSNGFGEIEQSVLQETVNIVSSAYLNAMGSSMGFKILPTIPAIACDLAGSLMEILFMEQAVRGEDEVLILPMQFRHNNSDLDWQFFIQPTPASLARLLSKLS